MQSDVTDLRVLRDQVEALRIKAEGRRCVALVEILTTALAEIERKLAEAEIAGKR